MKLKIGRSGYVLLPPDVLEAVGLSHATGGTVEVHLLNGSVVLGKPLDQPSLSCDSCKVRLALSGRHWCGPCANARFKQPSKSV